MIQANPMSAQMNAAIQAVRDRFVGTLEDRILLLEAAASALRADPARSDAFDAIRRESHKIAGLAGTIGFPEIGDQARAIDAALVRGGVSWQQLEPQLEDLMMAMEDQLV